MQPQGCTALQMSYSNTPETRLAALFFPAPQYKKQFDWPLRNGCGLDAPVSSGLRKTCVFPMGSADALESFLTVAVESSFIIHAEWQHISLNWREG